MAMLISLVVTLVIVRVVLGVEEQKRVVTSGSDAQSNGALAMAQLRQALAPAGYGYTQTPAVIGCPISALFGGAPVPGLPSILAPVVITDGAGGAPDAIRVLASAKASYAVPARLSAPYAPSHGHFSVASTTGIEAPSSSAPGDLMLAAKDASQPCEMFRVSGIPSANKIARDDETSGWNAPGHPSLNYDEGSYLINLGRLADTRFGIGKNALVMTAFRLGSAGEPQYDGPVEVQPNIVNLQALYGKDTDGDGSIDTWNPETPDSNAKWLRVLAVRVALVARSTQFARQEVTLANPQWDVGTAESVPDTVACGASRCLPIRVDHLADWKHYRYKIFDSIIPLRNVVWGGA